MIYTLPPLPYAPDALEPRISQQTIEYHYGKHLQTYIDNLNRLIEGTEYADQPLETIILTSAGQLFNNAAQVWNHTFFFESMTPDPEPIPLEIKDYLIRDFGSVETFKEKFKKAALDLFGSGWVWLVQDTNGRLHIISESNAGNPMTSGYKPLLTIDVWEHAYYIDYRNRRAAFADSFWGLINWNKVLERMHQASPAAIVMQKYVCIPCGWVYDPLTGDPEGGIAPGTQFKDLPEDWTCPGCGAGKEYFEPLK